ncbi:MAG: signal peptidase I [Firmicutes bacterium]|nr:signal peptidase I [Bacillota bacterium]
MNNNREEDRRQKLIRQIKKDIFIKLFVFAAGFFVTFTFIFGVALAPTNDMFPAIHEGDVILYFRPGGLAGSDIAYYEAEGAANIGRVQAAEGVRVDQTEGGLLRINGNIQPIQERAGLYYKTYIREGGRLEYPSAVPAGCYLILGDERGCAKDSRDYGYIPREDIKGKIFTIIRRRPL